MPIFVRSASWKAPAVFVRHGGTWKEPIVWVRTGGSWVKAHGTEEVHLSSCTVSGGLVAPATAEAVYRLNGSNAEFKAPGDASFTVFEQWLVFGNPADYEVMLTVTSGALASGPEGTWVSCASTPTWKVERTTPGSSNAECSLQLRRAATGALVDAAHLSLTATIINP